MVAVSCFSGLLMSPNIFSGRISSLSLRWHIWLSTAYMQSQSRIASFWVGYLPVSCNTYATAYIRPHAQSLTLLPETASTWAAFAPDNWFWSRLYVFLNSRQPVLILWAFAFFYIIESGDISYFCKDLTQSGFADSEDFLNVFYIRNLAAAFVQLSLDILNLYVQLLNLVCEPLYHMPTCIGAVLDPYAFLCIIQNRFCFCIVTSTKLCILSNRPDSVRTKLYQILWKRCFFQKLQTEHPIRLSKCVLALWKVNLQFPMQTIKISNPVLCKLITEHRQPSDICVKFLRQIRHSEVSIFYQVCNKLRILRVILKLTIVFALLCLLDCVGIELDHADPVVHYLGGNAETVMSCWFHSMTIWCFPFSAASLSAQSKTLSNPFSVLLEENADLMSSLPLVSIARA